MINVSAEPTLQYLVKLKEFFNLFLNLAKAFPFLCIRIFKPHFLLVIPQACGRQSIFLVPISLKDTHRENTLTNKTLALSKSMNMDIWVIGTLNQLFIGGSYIKIKFPKK